MSFLRYDKMDACLSQDLIERYVMGSSSTDEQRSVEAHLTHCQKCRQQIKSARSAPAASDQSDSVIAHTNATDKILEETRIDRNKYPTEPIPQAPAFPADARTSDTGFDTVFEGYKISDQIGQGGMGTVWRALQLSTQRQVALKVLATGTFASRKARIRFEREVELTARLEHPNVARIYDSGLRRGAYYYAMELFQGQHLDKYIADHQLSQRQILELFHTVCQAVQYAHQRGVIHRDLKASNIIVTDDGQPHILDFGLAKAFAEGDKGVMVSIDGDVTGTPAYMSPEQAGGHLDEVDTRTDVYSLGVILFNVLTNQWPHDISGSRYEVLRSIQEQEPIRPSRVIPHFDTDIEAILLKTLAKKPSERYQSVAELAHDIHCWLEGLPIIARSVDTLYLLRKFIVRHRAASIIVGLLLVIIVSTSFVSLYSYSKAQGAVKRLKSQVDEHKIREKVHFTTATQALFIVFLEFWHDERIPRARGTVDFFAQKSRERIACLFLLDPRPLDEKKADFTEKLAGVQPSFWEFTIAEYHLKNKNEPAAIEAYKRCLAGGQGPFELDDWFKNRAKTKLDELLNQNVPLRSRPNTEGSE